MYAIKASSRASTMLRAARKASVPSPMRVSSGARRVVAVRAESEPDYQAQASEAVTKSIAKVQDVWESTADAEKPAIIAILSVVVVAQIAIGATMGVVDKLPFFGDFFELVGLAVLGTYAYRYVTDPEERASAQETIDSFVSSVTGK